jgi:hypothetical protein
LQFDALEQGSPVSSKAQYVALEMVSQTVPVMQSVLLLQSRVHREAPPWVMGLHTRGEAHWPLEVQGSSSCRFIGPPELLDVDDVELPLDVDEALDEDDEDEAPELEVLVVVPELPVELVVLLLDEDVPPSLPPPPGTHWAFWSQL